MSDTLLPECLQRSPIDRNLPLSITRQLYLWLYEAIRSGALPTGTVMPPSRTLATALGIARNTVVAAYSQLADEALVSSAEGRSTRVVYDHPAAAGKAEACEKQNVTPELSGRSPVTEPLRNFSTLCPGEPDSSLFPIREWQRAMAKSAKLSSDTLGYHTQGLSRLQHSIARHLAVYRSLVVDPSRIILTSSTRQSLLLAATLYADTGDVALMESPGYPGAVEAFAMQGLELLRCPVDTNGAALPKIFSHAKLAYLTPCFHFPTGYPLSTERRESFLVLSRDQGTVLFEDDYDSEFRDQSLPRPALAAHAELYGACVLHAGTFSKLVFPAARVAWMVVPDAHIDAAWRCLRMLGGGHGMASQTAICELLDSGAISKHLQRARQIYAQRRAVLDVCIQRSSIIEQVQGGGLTAVVTLNKPYPVAKLKKELVNAELGVEPMERYLWHKSTCRTTRQLVLGVGNVDSLALPAAVKALEQAIKATADP